MTLAYPSYILALAMGAGKTILIGAIIATDKEAGIKKVRKTVDYLASKTNLICVVNTTGTPYFERQPLKDVVIWYGLSEGIRDGILKEIAGSIYAYSFSPANTDQFLTEVITDFFQNYDPVRLPNGAPAKLAVYFPQTDDLKELRPVIDPALVRGGQPHPSFS